MWERTASGSRNFPAAWRLRADGVSDLRIRRLLMWCWWLVGREAVSSVLFVF